MRESETRREREIGTGSEKEGGRERRESGREGEREEQ